MKYLRQTELSEEYNDALSIEDNLYKSFDDVYKYAMDMTQKETKQAAQGFYHNMNTLESRAGSNIGILA